MKTKVVVTSTLLMSVLLLIAQPVKFAEFIKTVADTEIPEQVTTNNIYCTSVTLLGVKGVRDNNAGIVYVGWNSTNNTQFFPITAGGQVVIEAGQGRTINLKDIYVDVLNVGDGVGVYYK